METGKPGSAKVAFKWTLIYVVTSIVITYAMQFLNVSQISPVKYLAYLPYIGFMFVAQKEYRDQLGGFITFGEGFVTGLLYAVFSAIILAVFLYFYLSILSPQAWQQILDAQRAALEGKNLPSDQVEQQVNIMQKYGIIITVFLTLMISPIVGSIVSLIGAAIFKKERSIVDLERDAPGFTDPVS